MAKRKQPKNVPTDNVPPFATDVPVNPNPVEPATTPETFTLPGADEPVQSVPVVGTVTTVTVEEITYDEHRRMVDAENAANTPTPEPEPEIDPIAAAIADGANLRAVMLCYDIPSASECDNPSWFFRKYGFRMQGSCWVLPESVLTDCAVFINELRENHNAKVEFIRYEQSEAPRIIRLAIEKMNAELTEQAERTADAVAKAEDKTLRGTEFDSEESRNNQLSWYKYKTNVAKKRLSTLLEDTTHAIQQFGVSPDALGLSGVAAAFDAMQLSINAKMDAYMKATIALRASRNNDARLLGAAAANGNGVPAYAMADKLIEIGNEKAAADLMAAQ